MHYTQFRNITILLKLAGFVSFSYTKLAAGRTLKYLRVVKPKRKQSRWWHCRYAVMSSISAPWYLDSYVEQLRSHGGRDARLHAIASENETWNGYRNHELGRTRQAMNQRAVIPAGDADWPWPLTAYARPLAMKGICPPSDDRNPGKAFADRRNGHAATGARPAGINWAYCGDLSPRQRQRLNFLFPSIAFSLHEMEYW